MTYGWAILIVVIAVAALAAFGVFNPDRFAQARCIGSATGLACDGTANVDPSTENVRFALTNGVGESINVTGVTADADGDCSSVSSFSVLHTNGTDITSSELRANEDFVLSITCSADLQDDTVFNDDFDVTFSLVDNPAIGSRSESIEVVANT